ncbi:MAG: PTS glucose transporter subunit IIA [Clostridiaceae bacterium]|nr:PTS glucose transporter subunit IIA [Clostridiaceae bacterium]
MFGIFKKSTKQKLYAPVSGRILDISEVPDEVFSKKLVGDGIAIDPSDGVLVAPCDGKLIQIFSTNHALGIQTPEGLEILIHIGIDTVELKGEGFKRIAESDAEIKRGDPLMEFDIDLIKKRGKSVITPVIITNRDKKLNIRKSAGRAEAGKSVVMTIEIE